jgi:cyclopropane-fatty-acyl-phospholipid synthase
MAYSCAYFREDPATDPGVADGSYGITEAQRDKLEVVCRKLGLQPGMRLLDVGCGWGLLLLHAAEHHGVHATGVTISAQQRDHVEKLVAERGLADRVSVRLQDYREVPVSAEGPTTRSPRSRWRWSASCWRGPVTTATRAASCSCWG